MSSVVLPTPERAAELRDAEPEADAVHWKRVCGMTEYVRGAPGIKVLV